MKLDTNTRIAILLDHYKEKGYTISREGFITNPKGKQIGNKPALDGYCRAGTRIGGRNKGENFTFLRRQVVWIYFNGPIPNDCFVTNKDNNRINDHIDNLALITKLENSKKAGKVYSEKYAQGLINTKPRNAKLNDEVITALRKEYHVAPFSVVFKARELGVAKTTLYFALNGKTYKHLPDKVTNFNFHEVKPKVIRKKQQRRAAIPKPPKIKFAKPEKIKEIKKSKAAKQAVERSRYDLVNKPKAALFDIKDMAARILARRSI